METSLDPKKPNYAYLTDRGEAAIAAQDLACHNLVAVDTEGTHLDPYLNKLLLLQIGTPEKAYIFDAQRLGLNFLKEVLKPILSNKGVLKILQNAKFDYEVLKVALGVELDNLFDTMLAERLVTCGLVRRQNSLQAITDKRLGLSLNKDWAEYDWQNVGLTGKLAPKHLNYAALDVLVLFPIFEKQFAEIKEKGLLKISQLEFALVPVVSEMELRGVYVDVKKWRLNLYELEKKRGEIAQQIQEMIRPLYRNHQVDLFGNEVDAINLNSQPQLMELFNDKLGVPLPSTGDSVLAGVNHPVAKQLREYRAYEKLLSAFGEGLLEKVHPVTGRLHPDYVQIGADTGRFACSNPNLQQIPKESSFRSCFVAPAGYKLITSDYSQQELRVMAELSQDPVLIKAYKDNMDLHTYTASLMFNIPPEKVRKDVERFQAKSINFGLMYGRGAGSLASQLGVTNDQAKELLGKYFKTYKKVKKWLDSIAKTTVRRGYSETIAGRKRWYELPDRGDPNYDRLLGHIERMAKNTPIQGSSADMVKYALVYIHKRIKAEKLDAGIVHTVHDEIVTEARADQAEQVAQIVKEEMTRSASQMLKSVPIGDLGLEVSEIWEH